MSTSCAIKTVTSVCLSPWKVIAGEMSLAFSIVLLSLLMSVLELMLCRMLRNKLVCLSRYPSATYTSVCSFSLRKSKSASSLELSMSRTLYCFYYSAKPLPYLSSHVHLMCTTCFLRSTSSHECPRTSEYHSPVSAPVSK